MPIVFLSYKLEIDCLVFLSGMYVHSIDLLHMSFAGAHVELICGQQRVKIMP